jgi:hypothetical protein
MNGEKMKTLRVEITTDEALALLKLLAKKAVRSHYHVHLMPGDPSHERQTNSAIERLRVAVGWVSNDEAADAITSAIQEFAKKTRIPNFQEFLTLGRKPGLTPCFCNDCDTCETSHNDSLAGAAKLLIGAFWAALDFNPKYRQNFSEWAVRFEHLLTPNEYGGAPHFEEVIDVIRTVVTPYWADKIEQERTKDAGSEFVHNYMRWIAHEWNGNGQDGPYTIAQKALMEEIRQDAQEYVLYLMTPDTEESDTESDFSDPLAD